MERCLGEALSAGGDYADLYFESVTSTSLGIDESLVKSASQGISVGCGVRVVSGERTGYAYTDDLSTDRLLRAARTAALIASGPAKELMQGFRHTETPALYPVAGATSRRRDRRQARRSSSAPTRPPAPSTPRITQVRAGFNDELRRILIAASDGTFASDTQPLARLNVFVIAKDEHEHRTRHQRRRRPRHAGLLRRRQIARALRPRSRPHRHPAARTPSLRPPARWQSSSAPAGPAFCCTRPSAMGSKPTSTARRPPPSPDSSASRSPVQQGHRRRQRPDARTAAARINVDDEGNPTQETVLIENGILNGYLSDKLSSRLMGMPNTGSGRRESYHHIPMPRMTNTYMLNGDDMPEDIIKCVKRGLYAVNFGGGQVDITNGKFVFSASEAYLIEDGKVTRPVKGATLIGNGPEALKYVSMVGNDLALDEGIGTCGKAGQSVPVGVGMPTVKLDRMTVGGTGQ